ncbi:MAG: hypothetical protein ACK2UL_03580 [Anaerolineae bacterium]|jgi:hypothetical protein
MIQDYPSRPAADSEAERKYLRRRLREIEVGMGEVAAGLEMPTPITQELDALDRARELTNDMLKQIRVRSLEDAIAAQLDWLDRVEARQTSDDPEPKPDFDKIPLDRKLLIDLREGWRAEQA